MKMYHLPALYIRFTWQCQAGNYLVEMYTDTDTELYIKTGLSNDHLA